MRKKLTSIVLVLCMIVSCVAVGSFATAAASTNDNSVSASVDSGSVEANYGLASKIEDGNILHCFDWKYNDIKAELKNIAEAGFTAVQTSPVQTPDPLGQWYGLYLPREFNCTSGPLGSKAELQALCAEADNYGIKVICDVVANHLTGDHANIQNDLKDSQYWHTWGAVPDDKWGDRGWVTNGEIGMADLNTNHSYVQQVVFNYLESLKAIGVDGFRFDAAKHIGLPSEGDGFWKKIAQTGVYRYGEILDNPGGDADSIMKEYADYIGITDSVYSGTIMGAVRDGNVNISYGGNWVNRGIAPEKIVYWAESHDTFSNNPPPASPTIRHRLKAAGQSTSTKTRLTVLMPSSAQRQNLSPFTSPDLRSPIRNRSSPVRRAAPTSKKKKLRQSTTSTTQWSASASIWQKATTAMLSPAATSPIRAAP